MSNKISLTLSDKDIAKLQKIAKRSNIPMTEALTRCISVGHYLDKGLEKGNEFFVLKPNGEFKQILFKND